MICNGTEWIISAKSGLGTLQMVSESDTEQCANKDARSLREVDCEISHRLERGTVMLTMIYNGPKRTISTRSGLETLQSLFFIYKRDLIGGPNDDERDAILQMGQTLTLFKIFEGGEYRAWILFSD